MDRKTLLTTVILGALAVPALAQEQQPPPQNQNRQRFDPAQMRERFLNSLKEQMAASDDEWKVLQPKMEKLFEAQRNTRGGFFGRRGGDRNTADTANLSPVAKASQDLRSTLDNKSAAADEIAKKLAALREAREKAKTEYQTVQKEIKELLTQRQEAVLVNMGLLD